MKWKKIFYVSKTFDQMNVVQLLHATHIVDHIIIITYCFVNMGINTSLSSANFIFSVIVMNNV